MKRLLVLLSLLSAGSIFAKDVDWYKEQLRTALRGEDKTLLEALEAEFAAEEQAEHVAAVMKGLDDVSAEILADEFVGMDAMGNIDRNRKNFDTFLSMLRESHTPERGWSGIKWSIPYASGAPGDMKLYMEPQSDAQKEAYAEVVANRKKGYGLREIASYY